MKLVVGVSGASGIPYAARLLEVLDAAGGHEIALIVSDVAQQIAEHEIGRKLTPTFENSDIAAPPASGSAGYEAMVVVPCSMKTLAGIATGYSDNLILRAADVMLKEGKKLILVPRETPLSLIHLKNMVRAKEAGATILPAMPAFYYKPECLGDQVDFIAGKVLEQLGIEHKLYKKWQR